MPIFRLIRDAIKNYARCYYAAITPAPVADYAYFADITLLSLLMMLIGFALDAARHTFTRFILFECLLLH